MKTNPQLNLRPSNWARRSLGRAAGTGRLLSLLALVVGISRAALGVELITNGGFLSGFNGWQVGATVPAGFDPLVADHAVNLHPPATGFSPFVGDVLYQNLNVSGVGGRSATVSLRLMNNSAPPGKAIAAYLEYVTTGNTVERIQVVNPDNAGVPVGSYTNLTATVSLPANARKLVKFVMRKEGSGQFLADDFSVSMTGVTVGAVPEVLGLDTVKGNYGTVVTVLGTGFGSATGQVLMKGDSAGLTVLSWTDAAVQVRVQEPSAGGALRLVADFTESNGRAAFFVTSGHFTLNVKTPSLRVVQGQKAQFLLAVDFHNGFATTGGVGFLLPENPAIATFSPAVLRESGGVIVDVATGTLPPGKSRFTIQSLEDRSYARFTFVEIEVVSVAGLVFSTFGPSGQTDYNSVVPVNAQGQIFLQLSYTNNLGERVIDGGFGGSTAMTVTSGDPSRLIVHRGNFGYEYYANESGNVPVTVTTPDGTRRDFTFQINVPATPKVNSVGVTPSPVANDGNTTNYLTATATENVGVSAYGFLNMVNSDVTWSDDRRLVTWQFQVGAGTMPGNYLVSGFTGGFSGGRTAERFALLTVVNAPARGQITGRLKPFDSGFMHEVSGVFELYSQTQPATVVRQTNQYFGDTYNATYLPPDQYKIRFVPDGNTRPVWYPSASDQAGATTVTVNAGQTVSNIDFVLFVSNTPPSVAITNPLPAQTVNAGANMPLAAAASDADGSIVLVEFFADGLPIGAATVAPFAITYTNTPVGTHLLTARATDNLGATTTSEPVSITATGLLPPPTYSLTSPTKAAATFTVSLNTAVGWTYTLQYKNQVQDAAWTDGPSVVGNGAAHSLVDSTVSGVPRRIYRVRAQR